MNGILLAVLLVAGIALLLGFGLAVASIVLKVEKNPLEEKVRAVLPGANCGACSFAGCDEYAKALATGKVKTTLCPVGGAEGVKKISAVLGIEAAEQRKKVAFVHCRGCTEVTSRRMAYTGIQTCYACKALVSGNGACVYGCNGFGDCVKACQYGAISVVDGVAVVDCGKCVGCGMCAAACPKKLITLEYTETARVACRNADKGAETRTACKAGCIGCGKCVKTCEENAIVLEANRAVIDMEKCVACGKCAENCPVGCIVIRKAKA